MNLTHSQFIFPYYLISCIRMCEWFNGGPGKPLTWKDLFHYVNDYFEVQIWKGSKRCYAINNHGSLVWILQQVLKLQVFSSFPFLGIWFYSWQLMLCDVVFKAQTQMIPTIGEHLCRIILVYLHIKFTVNQSKTFWWKKVALLLSKKLSRFLCVWAFEREVCVCRRGELIINL